MGNDGRQIQNEAVGTVISEFGNLDELSETLGLNRQQYNTPSDNRRCLSIEEIKKYIRAYNVKSILIAIGVFLCIISPIFPIIGDMIGITFIEKHYGSCYVGSNCDCSRIFRIIRYYA